MHLKKTIYTNALTTLRTRSLLFLFSFSFSLLFLPITANGQRAERSDTLAHQIGVNLSPVLRYNDHALPWIDYRYFYNERRAIRLQLGFDGNIRRGEGEAESVSENVFSKFTTDSTITTGPDEYTMALVRGGHLWYWGQGKNIYFVAGIEGQFKYWRSVEQREITWHQFSGSNVTTIITDHKIKKWSRSFGVIPTFGVAWLPSERFSLSLESGAGFFWGNEVQKNTLGQDQSNSSSPNNSTKFLTTSYRNTKIINYKVDPFIGLIVGFRI